MEHLLKLLDFHEALVISISVFFADWVSGVTAAIRSGRHVKSSIMRQTISGKAVNYFHFVLIGLAFSYTTALQEISAIVVLIPAVPEILSIFENIKIMRTKVDTKPKEGKGDGTDSSSQ